MGDLSRLAEALGCAKKLYRVSCERTSEKEKSKPGEWNPTPSAYVVATSIENAALKAVQFFNQKDGVTDYEAHSMSVYADVSGNDNIFIE